LIANENSYGWAQWRISIVGGEQSGKGLKENLRIAKNQESVAAVLAFPVKFSENVKNILQTEPEPETLCHKQAVSFPT